MASVHTASLADIRGIHRLVNSMPSGDERFFHPGYFGTRHVDATWVANHVLVTLCTSAVLTRAIMLVWPRLARVVCVATSGEGVLGFAYLSAMSKTDGSYKAVLGIAVAAEARGRGVGGSLMRGLIRASQRLTIKTIELSVLVDNVRAVRLYRGLGFKETGRGIDRWGGRSYDTLLMRLDLRPPRASP